MPYSPNIFSFHFTGAASLFLVNVFLYCGSFLVAPRLVGLTFQIAFLSRLGVVYAGQCTCSCSSSLSTDPVEVGTFRVDDCATLCNSTACEKEYPTKCGPGTGSSSYMTMTQCSSGAIYSAPVALIAALVTVFMAFNKF